MYKSISQNYNSLLEEEDIREGYENGNIVSVIVPTTHSRHKFLPRIIDCFNNQTYKDKELIIYDTDSDHKYYLEESNNIRYFHNKEKVSIGKKRNFMAKQARGGYICHFDDDDYYFPEYIETMMNELGDYDFIKLASYTLYNEGINKFMYFNANSKQSLKNKFSHYYGYGFTYFYKKEWILNFPMEDINFREDRYWLENVVKNGISYKYILEDNPLVIHTIHKNGTSNHFQNSKVPWDIDYLSSMYNQTQIVEGYENKFNTYVLLYGYNYEKQLAEFLTYYLYILEFDYVIFVEDFKTTDDYEENSIMKNICSFFGNRVIYDYLIREQVDTYQKNRICKKDDRDCFQIYITKYWSTKLKESINDLFNTWLLYVNGDEFLNLNEISINMFLNKYSEDYKGISFLQHIFGTNGIEEHKYDSLLIDTHRKSVPSVNWYSNTHYKNTGRRWPLNTPAGDSKGFKAMYRLDSIDGGWVHRIKKLDNNTLVPKIKVANINHYMIIDKKSVLIHFYVQENVNKGNIRKRMREYTNIDLNNEGKEYTDLHMVSNEIRSNPSYIQAIDYLSSIYDNIQIVEGYEENNNEYYEGYINGQKYVFIHVGKTGGGTIHHNLKKILKKYKQIHLKRVVYEPNTKYILWIRDPISRFVSAFYFRQHKIPDKYLTYETVNDFAENLFTPQAQLLYNLSDIEDSLLHDTIWHNHMYRDMAYYLNDGQFIIDHHKDIIFVGTQENFDDDMLELKKILGIPIHTEFKNHHIQKYNKSKYLSPLAIENLKKNYEKDYYCIELLVKYGLIDYNKVKSYFE